MTTWVFLGILTAAALLLSAVGFYEFIWFLSVGYGFAVCGIGIADVVIGLITGTFLVNGIAGYILLVQAILFIVYGIRLGGFLFVREMKSVGYKKTRKEIGVSKKVPIFVSVPLWLICAVLYVGETAGVSLKIMNNIVDGDCIEPLGLIIAGAVIQALGIFIEALADKQKSDQKAKDPDMVATKGLYKFVRCPNYFGEVLFWTGVFVSGLTTYKNGGQWALAIICYISIVYIMFNGCQRLDKRQTKRLANNAQFEEYASKTPILIPFIPWTYHCDAKEVAREAQIDHAKKLAKKFEAENK